jgi:hypothetical protein
LIRSAIFDAKLLEMGDWDPPVLTLLREWVETEDYTDKRLRAAELIPTLTEATIGTQLTYDGKIKSKRIGRALMYFEDLLLTSKSGLGNKFYRDHINHMIRVTILARAIAKLCFKREAGHETIAALFHDLGYPVAESRSMVEGSVAALESCYSSVKFAQHFHRYDMEKATRLVQMLEPYDDSHQLGRALNQHEHSVIGAMEFLDYVADVENYVDVLEAIVFHDPSFDRSISIANSPVLATLVIADELQDWGRPIGFEKVSAIDSIANFELSEGRIRGHMLVAGDSLSFSPLRQIVSKTRNLGRLKLDAPLKFELEFHLPEYQEIAFNTLEDLTRKLAQFRLGQNCDITDALRLQAQAAVFHKTYYGVSISEETNRLLIERLQAEHSPMIVTDKLLFASDRKEILQLKSTYEPKSFVISANGDNMCLHLKSSNESSPGQLSDMSDTPTRTEAEKIVAVIRAFNLLLRYGTDKRGSLRELNEFLGKPEEMLTILKNLGLSADDVNIIKMLRSVRSTIQQQGFFHFAPSSKDSSI